MIFSKGQRDACLFNCPPARNSCLNVYPNSTALPWNFPKLGRQKRLLQKLMEAGLVSPAVEHPWSHWTASRIHPPHPIPGSPSPGPAGVFGEVHRKSHPVHVPRLNYRLNFLFCLIPKSICVHTYLIGRLFLLEWGLVLHLSPHCLEGI